MTKTEKIYITIACISVLALGTIITLQNGGISFPERTSANNDLGIVISTNDLDDTFVKNTKLGNPITFHYQNNTLTNESMITGLSSLSFKSNNNCLLVSNVNSYFRYQNSGLIYLNCTLNDISDFNKK